MPLLHVAAERIIPAPTDAAYALLADYRNGHPRILPPAFTDLTVLRGGTGAGTEIRFALERLIAPRLFRTLYAQELDLIERWAIDRASGGVREG